MTNAELIKQLRGCKDIEFCSDCPRMPNGIIEPCGIKDDAADALEAAEKRIADLETALAACRARKGEQLPKEGEWIEDDATYCGADLSNYKCSLCGKIGGTWRRGLKQDELPPFCGSCGARMKGGQE
ncbi:MAG: hypothetical protein IIY75_05220 [Erysipelotrichales bacterium]|nr:hypothetical protein [Erysipelotrichales bacterium]